MSITTPSAELHDTRFDGGFYNSENQCDNKVACDLLQAGIEHSLRPLVDSGYVVMGGLVIVPSRRDKNQVTVSGIRLEDIGAPLRRNGESTVCRTTVRSIQDDLMKRLLTIDPLLEVSANVVSVDNSTSSSIQLEFSLITPQEQDALRRQEAALQMDHIRGLIGRVREQLEAAQEDTDLGDLRLELAQRIVAVVDSHEDRLSEQDLGYIRTGLTWLNPEMDFGSVPLHVARRFRELHAQLSE